MKTTKIILVVLMVAGVALAQTSSKHGKKKASATTATTAAAKHPAAPQAAKKPAARSPMAPKRAAAPPPAPAPAAPGVAVRNKRDPFVSPVIARGPGPGPCAGGKRCLAIDQITIRGVVKGPKGWIAIVENPAKKTYFLMDNDELYDGTVIQIKGDGVLFKQNVLDAVGRTSTRQVERKLAGGPAA